MKQADVVLLGYPVPFPLSPNVRRKNLEIYEAATSPRGPAMTWVRSLNPCSIPPHRKGCPTALLSSLSHGSCPTMSSEL